VHFEQPCGGEKKEGPTRRLLLFVHEKERIHLALRGTKGHLSGWVPWTREKKKSRGGDDCKRIREHTPFFYQGSDHRRPRKGKKPHTHPAAKNLGVKERRDNCE